MICEHCLVEFEPPADWTDEAMRDEMRANFGDLLPEDQAVVCEDCYQRFTRWLNG